MEIVTNKVAQRLNRRPEEVKPECSFYEDLQADPLELTEVIMALQEEFGIRAECEVSDVRTVADAIRYVETRLYE